MVQPHSLGCIVHLSPEPVLVLDLAYFTAFYEKTRNDYLPMPSADERQIHNAPGASVRLRYFGFVELFTLSGQKVLRISTMGSSRLH